MTARAATTRPPSSTTEAARRFVETHQADAFALGARLAEEIDDPASFVAAAEAGMARLADPSYLAGQRLVAPGIGPIVGLRQPLLDAIERGLVGGLRGIRPARLLFVADALAGAELREERWLACRLLGRIVLDDPERAWQVLRRIGRQADDWITVDTLAGTIAPAILREPFRWAELEQLVFSPLRWERRLVGSTVASIVFARHADRRSPDTVARGLDLIGMLMGDAEPDVQKALGWAIRNMARADLGAVTAFCRRELEIATATRDGQRAWVLRDAAPKLAAADAAAIGKALQGIRRVPGTPSTSRAAEAAAAFLSAGLPPTAAPTTRPAAEHRRATP